MGLQVSHGMKQILVLLLLVCFTDLVSAQNLVVNGDFEQPGKDPNHQWTQPMGEFFHYEMDTGHTGKARSGLYYNGICMYEGMPSEYLHIQLAEQLRTGQEYCVQMHARLHPGKARKPENFKAVELSFSTRHLDVTSPVVDERKPDVILPLNLDSNLFEWQLLEATYTARGNEKYLTIGNFFESEQTIEVVETPVAATQLYAMNALYFGGQAAKNQKQSKKKQKEFREQMKSLNNSQKAPPPQVKTVKKSSYQYRTGDEYFAVRYYFDEVCIAPITTDKECTCLPEAPVVAYAVGDKIELRNIFFETGKWDLLPLSHEELDKLLQIMNNHPSMVIQINGHTDNRGTTTFNDLLSHNRAEAVADYLFENEIAKSRVKFNGFGPQQPIATNETAEGRSRNRRVEFEILAQ